MIDRYSGADISCRISCFDAETLVARPVKSSPHSPVFRLLLGDMQARLRDGVTPAWVLAPLRLFLGVTFVYAGMQKLTDPQFFKRSAPGYIGKQILVFAHGTPLHGFLLHVAEPHAVAFGLVVALGEIAIGLGTLLGLLLRPAAFFGALVSLVFFLSASWRVYPYFYGADIVFLFGWITLILADPAACGWPALDVYAVPALRARLPRAWAPRFDRVSATLLGVGSRPEATPAPASAPATTTSRVTRTTAVATTRAGARGVPARSRGGPTRHSASRREFLRGAATGGAGMLILAWLWSITHHGNATSSGGSGSVATTTATDATASATGGSGSGNVIAQVSQVAANDSTSFTVPTSGDPGVLVHLSNGQFVAFDATCTHAGCPVRYDPSSKFLLCPCHGAAFDPANNAAVVQGPADTPLLPVSIHVDNATGAITLA